MYWQLTKNGEVKKVEKSQSKHFHFFPFLFYCIPERGVSILLGLRRGQSRPEGGVIDQRFNSSVESGTLLLFLRCFYNFLLTDLIEKCQPK